MTGSPSIQVFDKSDALPVGWDGYVNNHPEGRLFHTKSWLTILEATYHFRMHSLAAINENSKLVGLLPGFVVKSRLTGNRFVSSPFSYVCGPIADNASVSEALLQRIRTLTEQSKLKYSEVKSDLPLAKAAACYRTGGGFTTYRLDIRPSEDDIWKTLHKNMVRRGIEKARREGVTVECSTDESDAREFDYLNRVTSRSHGIPAQPLRFFEAVWRPMISAGLADCFFATFKQRQIAGLIVFYDKSRAVYMYGASLPGSLSLRPNHLLLWAAIRQAKQRGMTEFDFGRVSPDNQGLADFKKRWGTVEHPLHYYYWPEKKGTGSIDRESLKVRIATGLYSKLPLTLTSRLSFLYRHLA